MGVARGLDRDAVFDRTGRVPAPGLRPLAAELCALAAWRPTPPDPAGLPRGDGGPVLVVPAFLTGDAFTAPLRRFLDRCGHRTAGWDLGANWGPTPALLDGLRRRVLGLRAGAEGARVALVGHSLGGLMARHLACEEPATVRAVVTLGSPIRLPTASPLAPLFRPLLGRYAPDLDLRRLAAPLPVPATAIWTRRDGVVAWRSCLPPEGEASVEVTGAHMTLARDPAALAAAARALAAAPP